MVPTVGGWNRVREPSSGLRPEFWWNWPPWVGDVGVARSTTGDPWNSVSWGPVLPGPRIPVFICTLLRRLSGGWPCRWSLWNQRTQKMDWPNHTARMGDLVGRGTSWHPEGDLLLGVFLWSKVRRIFCVWKATGKWVLECMENKRTVVCPRQTTARESIRHELIAIDYQCVRLIIDCSCVELNPVNLVFPRRPRGDVEWCVITILRSGRSYARIVSVSRSIYCLQ